MADDSDFSPLGTVARGLGRLNSSLQERFWYTLERFMIRGAGSRLLVIVAAVGVFSVAGGVLVRLADTGFQSYGDAIWWAFLRLTDPGYLGDDRGFWRAFISTILTIAGYVFFLGALVAILTQWLNKIMGEFELGLRPVSLDRHVVVLGWGGRTIRVIEGLVMAGTRGDMWLEATGKRRLRVATLVDRLTPTHAQDLRDRLGREYDDRELILRTGSALKLDHLRRVDVGHATAVVLPANAREDSTAEASSDARVIKTALALSAYIDHDELPTLVAEIGDERKIEAARNVYAGRLAAIPSDRVIAAVLARSLSSPGAARLVGKLLAPGHGASFYVRAYPQFVGKSFGDVVAAFDRAIPVGIVHADASSTDDVVLAPVQSEVIGVDDQIVLVAQDFEATRAGSPAQRPSPEPFALAPIERAPRDIVVLGWNRLAAELLEELADESPAGGRVTVISMIELERRQRDLEEHGFVPDNLEVEHVVASFTRMSTLRRYPIAQADGIVVLASDWHDTGEQADAHSLTAVVMLLARLEEAGVQRHPPVVVELTDDDNAQLVTGPALDAVTGSVVVSHALAQAVLNPSFAPVIQAVLASDGGFSLRPATDFLSPGEHTFEELQQRCRGAGVIAIGVTRPGHDEMLLAPPRDQRLRIDESRRVVLFSAKAEPAKPSRS